MMIHLKYKLLILSLLISACSFGQYPDSLLKYMESAAKNNPVVRQKFYEYQASLQKIPQAGALQDPELSLGVFLKPMELVAGKQRSDLTLMQMFPWFGVLRNAKDEMSLMANAKFEEFRDSKLQVFYDVQRTWYDLYKLRKDIGISDKNIEILKSIESLLLVRYRSAATGSGGNSQAPGQSAGSSTVQNSSGSSSMSGMNSNPGGNASGSPGSQSSMLGSGSMGGPGNATGLSDLYRIKIEISDLENNIAFLKDQEKSVMARFNSLLNRSAFQNVYSADTVVTDTLDLSLSEISDSIRSGNPMLAMIENERQSYEARKKMVRGMGYPMVGLGLNYSFISKNEMSEFPDMNGKDMVMPMVRLTLPIYRKKYKAMQNEADLLSRSAAERYTATSNDLQTEYYQAVQMYQNSRRKIILYDQQYQLASKTLELMLKSFSTSGSDLTDVLRVTQQTLDYELNRTEAAADFNTAVAWIKRLMASSDIE